MTNNDAYEELIKRVQYLEHKNAEIEYVCKIKEDFSTLLDAIKNAQSLYIMDANPSEIYNLLLKTLVEMSQSEYGFLDEVLYDREGNIYKRNLAISDISWDDKSKALYRQLKDRELKFTYLENLSGLAALTGKTIISNEPSRDGRSKGLPTGHPPINSFMGMPLYFGGRLICVAGVANRTKGYNKDLANFLEPLLTTCASITFALQKNVSEEENKKKIADSEIKYKTLAKNFPNGAVVLFDHDLRYIVADGKGLSDAGLDGRNMIGKTIWEVFPKETCDIIESDYRAALRGEHSSSEIPFAEKVFRTHTLPVFSDDGVVKFGMVVTQDITESKKAFEEIRKSNERMRLAADSANFGIWDLDPKHNRLEWDEWMFRLYGMKRESFSHAYEGWKKRIHPDDLERIGKEVEQALRGEKEFDTEFRIVRPDGKIRLLKAHAIVTRDNTGEPIKMTGINYDITEQKNIESNLAASERKWRNILINTPQIGISLNPKGKITFANKHFLKLTGWTEEEVSGRDWFELCIPPEKRDEIKTVFRSVMNGKGKLDLTTYENEVLTRSGERRVVSWSNVLTRDLRGGIIDVTCLGVDLTERMRAEARLQESESRYRTIFENNLNPIALIDTEGHYLEANRAFYDFTQTDPQTLLNRSVFDFSPPNRKKNQVAEHRPAWSSGGTFETEYLIGDLIKTLELSVTPIQYKGRKAVVGVGVDITERKKFETSLRESEEKFRDLSSMLPQIVFETDSRLNLTFVNKNAFSTFLYTEEEFENGLNGLQMISPSDRKRATEMIRQKMAGDTDESGNEYLAVKKDGTEFPVIIYSSRILRNGVPAGIRGVMIDISDRKTAEEKLRESEEKFRLTFDASPDSVNINRLHDGLYVDINQGFTELTGYTREDVIGKTSVEINIWNDIGDRKKLVDALKDSGVCENLQAQFKRKDGSVTTALMSARVIHLKGEPHIISVTRDISERIKADNVIRESELKFRSLYELSPQAIALTRIESGELLDVNDRLCELTKYSREEIIGKTSTEIGFYSEKDRRIFIDELNASGQVSGLEMDFFAKDGSILTALMFAKPVKIMGETQLLTIFHNITEQKRLQINISQAQRMEAIGNLAGGIAHDFNNLLFPIIGMSELLIEDLDPESVQYENVKEILKAGMRGSDLVKQILAFSRQSEHKMIPVRVQQVLREVVKLSRATIPADIEIREDIQKDCGLVLADPSQLHQIGLNLITNAYHALEETGGNITVSLREQSVTDDEHPVGSLASGRYAVLSVKDNGPGIPPHAMEKIFEPYFTTKEQGKGTGLGLSVVYGIVKAHRGDIVVHSLPLEETRFDVYLPLLKESQDVSSHRMETPTDGGTERILLVDDDEAIGGLERQMLERSGYRVTTKNSSHDALETFTENPYAFDLVVTDMTMPRMTGDQLAKRLMDIRPDIPVIICTGFSERINKERAFSLGIKGFLMKPVVKSEMARMVRQVLDAAKGKNRGQSDC